MCLTDLDIDMCERSMRCHMAMCVDDRAGVMCADVTCSDVALCVVDRAGHQHVPPIAVRHPLRLLAHRHRSRAVSQVRSQVRGGVYGIRTALEHFPEAANLLVLSHSNASC